VRAVSVNPVDYKVRASAPAPEGAAKVIGWDAAGIVVEAGQKATLFKVGDEGFYAGSIARPGTMHSSIWSTSASSGPGFLAFRAVRYLHWLQVICGASARLLAADPSSARPSCKQQ
jgi:NADPH:quinone reductase-like Zn-dependent oxidoreductase